MPSGPASLYYLALHNLMQIIPLSEGSFTIDQSKQFIPFDTGGDSLNDRSRGSLLVEIQPFVVITEEDVLLLDTGLGYAAADGILQIHHNLVQAGINPLDVTRVLLTHLHKDHAGGISVEQPVLRDRQLAFPQATYYVQRAELDHAYAKAGSSYAPVFLDVLRNSDQLVLTEGDGMIGDRIRFSLSGGHSPFHQVFWIRERGETVFFGGDEAPQLQQMKSRFVAKYDFDGRKAMELRRQWWETAQHEGWTFLFYHDIKHPILRVGGV